MGNNSSKTKQNTKKFNDLYDLGEEIGIGTYARVYKCCRKSDLSQFAVKIMNKKYLTQKELEGLEHEMEILAQISHENIIELIDIFEDCKHHKVYMVLELCDGSDLFDAIVYHKNKRLSERRCAKIIFKLCDALEHLHNNGIVHRDIKLSNILLNSNGTPKITDFGLSFSQFLNGTVLTNHASDQSLSISSTSSVTMSTCCGTPSYVAPEIICNEIYDQQVDMWSLGVVLFVMLTGNQPFVADSLKDIYSSIVKGKYSFRSKRWNKISKEAKHLVTCLLNVDPCQRYCATQVKNHRWIKKYVN